MLLLTVCNTRPPVEESLVDILEEDPGAQGFRIGLAHRAGAYPEAAILSSGFWQATYQPINQSVTHPPEGKLWSGV